MAEFSEFGMNLTWVVTQHPKMDVHEDSPSRPKKCIIFHVQSKNTTCLLHLFSTPCQEFLYFCTETLKHGYVYAITPSRVRMQER